MDLAGGWVPRLANRPLQIQSPGSAHLSCTSFLPSARFVERLLVVVASRLNVVELNICYCEIVRCQYVVFGVISWRVTEMQFAVLTGPVYHRRMP